MKLYFSRGACSLAVRIIIHELKLNCDYEAVDLASKEMASGGNFLSLNPKGSVPTLQLDNGEILTENAVIQQYLADHFKGEVLLPPSRDFKRYRVLEWLNFMSTDVHKSFAPLFNTKVPEELKQTIFIPILKGKLNFVNQQLEHHQYLMGDSFTLPDSYLFAMLCWLAHFHLALKDWPALERYFNDVKQRPAVAEALAEEGIRR